MTTLADKQKRNDRIKDLAIAGTPIKKIASLFNMSPSRVRAVLNDMVSRGVLIRIPNSSPAIYEDPRPRVTLTNGEDQETGENEGFDENNEYILPCLPSSGTLPLGWVNKHLSGFVKFDVRRKGTFDKVPVDRAKPGEWGDPKMAGKGQTAWRCKFELFGQELSVTYYESDYGRTQFRVNVGRIYIRRDKVDDSKVKDLFISRANYVAGLLRATGWRVSNPEIRGTLHTAKENDPLAKFIPKDVNDAGNDIIVDTSPGVPETEMEHCSDPELEQIYANMPSAIKELRQGVAANAACMEGVRKDIADMMAHLNALREVLALNSSVLDDVTGVAVKQSAALGSIQTATTRQTSVLEGLQTVVAMQSTVLARLSDNVTALAEMEAKSLSMATQSATVRFPPFSGVEYQ